MQFEARMSAPCGQDRTGRSPGGMSAGKRYFPLTMVDMCSVGEETGELEETLDNVADYYTNEADYRIQRLGTAGTDDAGGACDFAGNCSVDLSPIFTMYDPM